MAGKLSIKSVILDQELKRPSWFAGTELAWIQNFPSSVNRLKCKESLRGV